MEWYPIKNNKTSEDIGILFIKNGTSKRNVLTLLAPSQLFLNHLASPIMAYDQL